MWKEMRGERRIVMQEVDTYESHERWEYDERETRGKDSNEGMIKDDWLMVNGG